MRDGQDAIKCRLLDLSFGMNRRQRITLEVVDGDFRPRFDKLKDKDVSVTVSAFRKKRSLDANAYAWVLIDKLAEAMGLTKTEVYRTAIREIGGVSETVCVEQKAVEHLCELWEGRGLGWQTEQLSSKIKGCVNVVLYCGSSSYDTKQMTRLIDLLVYECKALDIETLPPEKLDLMKREWGGK